MNKKLFYIKNVIINENNIIRRFLFGNLRLLSINSLKIFFLKNLYYLKKI